MKISNKIIMESKGGTFPQLSSPCPSPLPEVTNVKSWSISSPSFWESTGIFYMSWIYWNLLLCTVVVT